MSLRNLKRRKKSIRKKTDPEAAQRLFEEATQLKDSNKLEEAIQLYKRAISKNPQLGVAYNNIANTLCDLDLFQESLVYYQKACEIISNNHYLYFNYGRALYKSEQYEASLKYLHKSNALAPGSSQTIGTLGLAFYQHGQLDEAQKHLENALTIDPNQYEIYQYLGLTMAYKRNYREAVRYFTKLITLQPGNTHVWYLLSRYKRYKSETDADILAMERLLATGNLEKEDTFSLHFSLGRIYDELNLFRQAFNHYKQANLIKNSIITKPHQLVVFELRKYTNAYSADLLNKLSDLGSNSELPVFIVGMPRSGTSLVEQICASHSEVYGAGELPNFQKFISSLPKIINSKLQYPECLAHLKAGKINKISVDYLHNLTRGVPDKFTRITDKMPHNFKHLGLIKTLFPKARIIHCRRNSMDTCLSNFFQDYQNGHEFSYSLASLGLFYRKYEQLMAHWHNLLGDAILEVQYEDLVTNFDEQAKRIIDYLELPWQENCLEFYKTERMVRTASDTQVSQPIYTKSMQRWKNYREYLTELEAALASTSALL